MKTKGYDNHTNLSDATSLRKKVLILWMENPYTTPMAICKILCSKPSQLKYFHKKHGNTIKVYLSNFRATYTLGSPQKPLRHRRVFVWKDIPRNLLPKSVKTGFVEWKGWKAIKNRNQELVFRHSSLGSVNWFKEGKVMLNLRGAVQLAKVKELFTKAFHWFSPKQWDKYLNVPLREVRKHWVFDMGSPMPRFDIRKFERSHGIRIFSDGSHPKSVEVEETIPFWIGELKQATDEVGVQIRSHMALIVEYQKESKANRTLIETLTKKAKRRPRRKPKPLSRWQLLKKVFK